MSAAREGAGNGKTYAFRSTDGGATRDYSQAAPIAPQIVLGEARIGYATVRGAIRRTSGSGAHWAFIETPGTH